MEEEDNFVETNSVESPLRRIARLTSPRRDAFGPTGAEIGALALLNQQGGPDLLGFIGGMNADRLRAQDAYETQLGQVNEAQAQLARQADATARRGQDDAMIRAGLQYPAAGAAFPRVSALAGEEGAGMLRRLYDARVAFEQSRIAENNAQAARASSGGGGGGGGTAAPADLSEAQLALLATRRLNIDPQVRDLGLQVQGAIARLRTMQSDPLTANTPAGRERIAAAQAEEERLRALLRDARTRVINEVYSSQRPAAPQPAPQAASAPQPAAPPSPPPAAPQARATPPRQYREPTAEEMELIRDALNRPNASRARVAERMEAMGIDPARMPQ